jgi:hypothetical protein
VKRASETDDLRPEYDFASMKGGVRGKYLRRMHEGTKIVLIEPDVAEAFPTEAVVHEALRGILNTTHAVRHTGGLTDKSLDRRRRARTPLPAKRKTPTASR